MSRSSSLKNTHGGNSDRDSLIYFAVKWALKLCVWRLCLLHLFSLRRTCFQVWSPCGQQMSPSNESPLIKTPAWVQRMVSSLSFPWADRSASGSDACDFPKCSQPEGRGVILPVCVCAAGLGYHTAVHGSRHRKRHRHRGVRLVSHRGLLPCLEVFLGAGPELCC